MSADNWAQCPVCVKKSEDFKISEEKRVNESYGKVSREEYQQSVADLYQLKKSVVGDRMREDYEISSEEGFLFINYKASCKDCEFKHSFKHEEAML